MRNPDGSAVRGIRGLQPALGFLMIQVPFMDLQITIGVDFMIFSGNIPSLLSLRDIHDNGLHISLQRKVTIFPWKEHNWKFNYYFSIHEWTPHDLPFALCTQRKIRNLHRVFGHPSIRATTGFPKRVSGGQMDI